MFFENIMRYVVRSCYVEDTHEELIDARRFELIKHSRTVLINAFHFEEIFDNLISNYIEIETKCLSLATQSLVRRTTSYQDGYLRLAEINLAFTNYLSTGRAYVDKIPTVASKCFAKLEESQIKTAIKTELSKQYDSSFDYRFMEALRNHAQHSGKALNVLRPGLVQDLNHSDNSRELFIEPICSKTYLIEQGGFKSAILKECPESVNLLKCTRNHLLGLSRVQRAIRSLTKTAVSIAACHIEEGQAMLQGKVSGSLQATEAALIIRGNEVKEKIPLLMQWEEVRTWLLKRNEGIPDGISRYPSGKTLMH